MPPSEVPSSTQRGNARVLQQQTDVREVGARMVVLPGRVVLRAPAAAQVGAQHATVAPDALGDVGEVAGVARESRAGTAPATAPARTAARNRDSTAAGRQRKSSSARLASGSVHCRVRSHARTAGATRASGSCRSDCAATSRRSARRQSAAACRQRWRSSSHQLGRRRPDSRRRASRPRRAASRPSARSARRSPRRRPRPDAARMTASMSAG